MAELVAARLLASGGATRIRVLSTGFELPPVPVQKTFDLVVPYITVGRSIQERADCVNNIEAEAVASSPGEWRCQLRRWMLRRHNCHGWRYGLLILICRSLEKIP